MDHSLRWRTPVHGDRAHFEAFVCTDPERPPKGPPPSYSRIPHPRPCEYKVQVAVRRGLSVRQSPNDELWLGFGEAESLAAVSLIRHEGESIYCIRLIAVSVDYRGSSFTIGDEAKSVALDAITRRAALEPEDFAWVYSHIHEDNFACQRLAKRWAFNHVETVKDVQVWGLELPVPSDA